MASTEVFNQLYTQGSELFSKFDTFVSPSTMFVPSFITTLAAILRDFYASHHGSFGLRKVNFIDLHLWEAAILICVHPVLWNVIGRFEHYTRFLSKIFIKPRYGLYAVALWIIVIGAYRDILFNIAIKNQPTDDIFTAPFFRILGLSCFGFGAVLVLTSFFQLGFAGTYLGDYFGILKDKKITSFPFNILDDPMYDGSSLVFVGKAIL